MNMSQSRGLITSAEMVASTNKPVSCRKQPNQRQPKQKLTVDHRRRRRRRRENDQSSGNGLQTGNKIRKRQEPEDNETTERPSTRQHISKSIQQQLTPSTSSLPTLLAHSLLVALSQSNSVTGGSSNNNNNDSYGTNHQDYVDQRAADQIKVTALDNDHQHRELRSLDQHFPPLINASSSGKSGQEVSGSLISAPASALALIQEQQQSFSDWWNEYWSRQPFPSGYTQSSITLLACLITTIIVLIVVGNLLVCIAIFTEKSLKPTQNWFIASLAVSDMMLGLVVMPFSLARELMGFWIFGPLWCDIHEAIDVLLTTASINTLCLISLDRYWSITQAVSYLKKRTPRRGAFMIAFVWVFSAAVSLPPLFGWKKQSPTIIAPAPVQPRRVTHQSSQQTGSGNHTESAGSRKRRRRRAGGHTSDHIVASTNHLSRDELAIPLLGRQVRDLVTFLGRPPRASAAPGDEDEPEEDERGEQSRPQEEEMTEGYPLNEELTTSGASSGFIGAQQSATPLPVATSTAASSEPQASAEYPSCQLSDDIGYVLYSALGSFFIPCAVMIFTYIKIFLAARSRARRAISKQSRGQAAAAAAAASKQRAAQRRNNNSSQQPTAGKTATVGSPVATSGEVNAPAAIASEAANNNNKQQLIKGKIVVVERKKSLALIPTSTAAVSSGIQHTSGQVGAVLLAGQLQPEFASIQEPDARVASQQMMNRATYTCAELIEASNRKQSAAAGIPVSETPKAADGSGCCTLTTSQAKQASPSALLPATNSNRKALTSGHRSSLSGGGGDCSMITVMSASMDEVPVTRFNFSGSSSKPQNNSSQSSDGYDSDGNRKAAALLVAISQVKPPASDTNEQPDESSRLLLDRCNKGDSDSLGGKRVREQQQSADDGSSNKFAVLQLDINVPPTDHHIDKDDGSARAKGSGNEQEARGQQQLTTTNETCFMTIEEDSDMFEAQSGRTIVMIAANRHHPSGCKTVDSLAAGSGLLTHLCNHQSGVQLLESSEPTSCNNAVCRRRNQRSASSYCTGSSVTINDDDEEDDDEEEDDEDEDDDDDEEDDDEDELSDDCNGYSVSCGLDQYCPGATSCPHCQECEQSEQGASAGSQRLRLSIGDASPHKRPRGQVVQAAAGKQQHLSHKSPRRRASESQSITGDDNLSLTEYRSNEDSSSILGHDVLDATDSPRMRPEKKRPTSARSAQLPGASMGGAGATAAAAQRKKSIIGFRLTRLGSSAPLGGVQSGGLLALASQQSQQQQQFQANAGSAAASGGTRNLKALRQNFFLKLNQLTAKSVAKQDASIKRKKSSDTSPTGAQSSGTSYEPSVDYATTSQIHSATEYQPELTTTGSNDECNQNQVAPGRQLDSRRSEGSNGHDGDNHQLGTSPSTGDRLEADNQSSQGDRSDRALLSRCNQRAQSGGTPTVTDSGVPTTPELGPSQSLNGAHSASGAARPLGEMGGSTGEAGAGDNASGQPAAQPNAGSGNLKQQQQQQDPQLKRPSLQVRPQKQQQQHSEQFQPTTKSSLLRKNSKANHANQQQASSTGAGSSTNTRAYLASDNERHKRKLAKARERRATLILGLIMATFVCSWMPFFTFYVLRALCTSCRDYMNPRFEAFIFWMGYCNSAINPIIYTIFNRDFRKAFRKILFRCL